MPCKRVINPPLSKGWVIGWALEQAGKTLKLTVTWMWMETCNDVEVKRKAFHVHWCSGAQNAFIIFSSLAYHWLSTTVNYSEGKGVEYSTPNSASSVSTNQVEDGEALGCGICRTMRRQCQNKLVNVKLMAAILWRLLPSKRSFVSSHSSCFNSAPWIVSACNLSCSCTNFSATPANPKSLVTTVFLKNRGLQGFAENNPAPTFH